MQIGVVFPQTEIGTDPLVIQNYARSVENLGYQHILVYDHVLGASTSTRPDWRGPYTSETLFHEVFVLLGYLAALTTRVELITGVLILPQRQTALVAKQAAEVDVLSGGRLHLGIGVGWNPVEYEALNEDFKTRGARSEEQITVLRLLWTEPVVTFSGRWHHIDAAGINPLPIQRPIPIWFGGHAEATLKRLARLGDGWFPLRPPDAQTQAMIEQLRTYAQEAGRDPSAIGIQARLNLAGTAEDQWQAQVEAWHQLGATSVSVNTMGMKLPSPQAHIDMLAHAKEVLKIAS